MRIPLKNGLFVPPPAINGVNPTNTPLINGVFVNPPIVNGVRPISPPIINGTLQNGIQPIVNGTYVSPPTLGGTSISPFNVPYQDIQEDSKLDVIWARKDLPPSLPV